MALTSDRAFGLPVRIRGVVTAAQPDAEWGGRFFVQDETAGVFVENISKSQPRPGDLLEIEGLSHPGGYAPIITQPRWHRLGTAPLPAAKAVPIEQLMAGIEDSQRVEISGVIRSVRSKGVVTLFEVASGGYRLDINTPPPPGLAPAALIGARVRVRGTAATFFSGKLRHLITVTLHVPVAEDFIIEQMPASDPFADPIVPLDNLAQYRFGHQLGQRVHVKGVVTLQRPGEDLFLQDLTGGMQIKTRQPLEVAPGDVVEAVGFPNFEQFLPVIQDAIFRKTSEPAKMPQAHPVTHTELQAGYRHADLVSLRGRLLDRSSRGVIAADRAQAGQRTILTLQHSDFLFNVEGPVTQNQDSGIAAPIGSLLEVTGVCLMKIADDGRLLALQLLLSDSDNVRVLERPGWWTPQRLLIGLGGALAVLLVAASWIVMISRKNASLHTSVREKEAAQVALQHANDRLEERVRERSEQLKLQINARKDAEVHFNAVLTERTRVAQELHDTLEQTLTGVGLQMDTAAKFFAHDRERAHHHLELARDLLTQSQTEVRCSVWDLRSRSPEAMDLPALLTKITQQATEDTRVAVRVQAAGRVRPLPELIEENLLRVTQEALTNIIKHAQASRAEIQLDYGPHHVTLQIKDNGVGFEPANAAGPQAGHFGLLGMTERARRMQGQLSVDSQPGQGTTIRAVFPIPAPPGADTMVRELKAGL